MGLFRKIRNLFSPMNKVYGGPEHFRNGKEPEIRCVYAGPEYFEKKRREAEKEDAPYPENHAETREEVPEMQAVYAGPATPPKAEMRFVYAGPGYFSKQPTEPSQSLPPIAIPEGGWMCFCGHINTGNFCTECGAPRRDTPTAGPNPTMLA